MKSISLTAEKNENLVQKFVPAGTSQLNNYIALNVDLCFFHKFEMKNCGVCKWYWYKLLGWLIYYYNGIREKLKLYFSREISYPLTTCFHQFFQQTVIFKGLFLKNNPLYQHFLISNKTKYLVKKPSKSKEMKYLVEMIPMFVEYRICENIELT